RSGDRRPPRLGRGADRQRAGPGPVFSAGALAFSSHSGQRADRGDLRPLAPGADRTGPRARPRRGTPRMKAGTGWLSVAERGSRLGVYCVVGFVRVFWGPLCTFLIVPGVAYFSVS